MRDCTFRDRVNGKCDEGNACVFPRCLPWRHAIIISDALFDAGLAAGIDMDPYDRASDHQLRPS